MKPPFFLALLVLLPLSFLCISCEKNYGQKEDTDPSCPYDDIEKLEQAPDSLFSEISSYILNTPDSIAAGGALPIELRLEYPDPCYSFTKFAITETRPFEIDIRVKSILASCNVCLAVVVYRDFDTSIFLPTPGTYTISTYLRETLKSSIVVEAY